MKREVVHTIRHLGRTFNQEQWSEYCAACRQSDENRIRTTIGKYIWNDCDICLNPETWTISVKDGAYGYWVCIEWAECGNGVFAFGMRCNTGTSSSSFGVSWADKADTKLWNKGFESEKECKRYALRYALTRIIDTEGGKMVMRLREKIQKELHKLERPQYVQLSLFN